MPLSEEELRRSSRWSAPSSRRTPSSPPPSAAPTSAAPPDAGPILAGVCFVAGIAVLMAGAIAGLTVVGVLGFVVMLVSATVALAAIRGTSAVRRAPARPGPQPGMLDRFGTPWRRRHHDDEA